MMQQKVEELNLLKDQKEKEEIKKLINESKNLVRDLELNV